MGKSKNTKHLGPWCRLYASILDNPKAERLSDAQFRMWIKMMALATVHGGLIPLALEDVAFRLRKPIGKVRDTIQVFLSANLMERSAEGYILHDWEEMQFDSDVSTGRVRQFRERQKKNEATPNETAMKRFTDVSATANVTAPDTDTDTDTDTEEPEPKGSGGACAAKPDEDLPAWWPKRDRYGRVVSDLTDKILYDVGKAVLGKTSGGQVTKLRKLYRGDLRAVTDLLLQAHDKSDPGEWLAAVIRHAERDEMPTLTHEKYPEHSY